MSHRRRAWSWLAALLAVALLGVLALAGWAQWRPLPADDAARLAALGTASRLRGTPATADVLGPAALDEQITVLGPEEVIKEACIDGVVEEVELARLSCSSGENCSVAESGAIGREKLVAEK